MKSFKYTINGNVYAVAINSIDDTTAEVAVNGSSYKVLIDKPEKPAVAIKRPTVQATAPAKPAATSGGGTVIKSPLPGIIFDISVKVGDVVKKGQKLLVLEAMKMENAINANCDGEIKELKVRKGDSVLEGAELVVIG